MCFKFFRKFHSGGYFKSKRIWPFIPNVFNTPLARWQFNPLKLIAVVYGPNYLTRLNVNQLGKYIYVNPQMTPLNTKQLTSAAMRLGQPFTAAKQVLQPLTVKFKVNKTF